jgi:hypothetical protein
MLARILAHGAYLKLAGRIAHLILSQARRNLLKNHYSVSTKPASSQQRRDYFFANGKDFAEIMKLRDRNPFVTG